MRFLFAFLLSTFSLQAVASETLFYSLREHSADRICSYEKTLSSLEAHAKKLTILVPQAFYIDEKGDVRGTIDAQIYHAAVAKHIKVMALVTNREFDAKVAHQFLTNSEAQTASLEKLLTLCQQYHLAGVQFDFEMISQDDRDLLTHYFKQAADLMHQHGYQISFALAPVVASNPDSLFEKKLMLIWEGAYDFKKIGEFADFVSVMAYNQHASGTTPGSTAGYPWVEQVAKYTVSQIPAHKVSLGLPTYTTYWYLNSSNDKITGHFKMQMAALSYADAARVATDAHLKPYWDTINKNNFYLWTPHNINKFMFVQNANSFVYQYKLVNKYHLRGISIFDLGSEDPKLWTII